MLTTCEKSWPIDDVVTIQEKSDWVNAGPMDGVDYNQTGLRILPMSHTWDFEGGVQGWSLNSAGGWAHGFDTSLGATNGVHSGSSAIYTYNGNYPNRMSTTYWATSPTIDCSSCTGTWDLKFWKRLGIESSYDRAYVSVKSNTGWVNVYQIQEVPQTMFHSLNQPMTSATMLLEIHICQIWPREHRWFYHIYWMEYYDVVIEPRGNTGTGNANWTSLPFGPDGIGDMKMEHGLLSIDATIPQGSIMKWSLIDSKDNSKIPGFSDLENLNADLSIIDTEKHPSVQLKIQMETTSETPVIHSIKLGGGIIESFNSANPVGWTGFTSQSNGVISGNGQLSSPEWRFAKPFAAIDFDYVGTGSGNFEACFEKVSDCSSNCGKLNENQIFTLSHPSAVLDVRGNG